MALYAQTGNTFSAARGIGQIADAQSAALSSGRQMLQALTGAAQTVQKIGEVEFEKEMKVQAEKATIQGVIDGQINVSPDQLEADLRDDNTNFYNKAYNEAQRTQVAANVRRTVQEKSLVLAEQYKNDPDGYKAATQGLAEELISEYGIEDKESQSLFYKELAGEVSRYAPQIMRNQYVQSREIELAAKYESLQTDSNHALSSLRVTGDYDRYLQDAEALNARLDTMVQNGDISASEGLKMKQGFIQEGQAQLGWSRVGPQVESGNVSAAEASAKAWRDEQFKRGILTPDQIDSEFNRFMSEINSKKSELKAAAAARAKDDLYKEMMANGQGYYKNKVIKEGVNKEFATTFGAVADLSNPEVMANAKEFILSRNGVVPQQVINYVSSVQYSKDPAQIESVSSLVTDLIKVNPYIEEQLPEKDVAYVRTYQQYREYGLDEVKATELTVAAEAMTSEERRMNVYGDKGFGGSETKFQDKVKNSFDDYIDDKSVSWFSDDIDPMMQRQLRTRYNDLMVANAGIYPTYDAAKKATEDAMNRTVGVSYVGGKPRIMINPPEAQALGTDKYGEDNPVTTQFNEDIKPVLNTFDKKQLDGKRTSLVDTGITNAQGQKVYDVILVDKKGNPQTLYQDGKRVRWSFDPMAATEASKAQQAKKATAAAEKAKSFQKVYGMIGDAFADPETWKN